jgi:hypothetical protein
MHLIHQPSSLSGDENYDAMRVDVVMVGRLDLDFAAVLGDIFG